MNHPANRQAGAGATVGAHRQYSLVVIASSAGGLQALETIVAGLPADFPIPIAIVRHRTTQLPNYSAEILGRKTSLQVKFVTHAEHLKPGTIYIAPPDFHVRVDNHHRATLHDGQRIRHVLSSANPLFESAARALDGGVIAVVLTGYGRDATDGVQAVRAHGGIVLVQDEATADVFGMPGSAIATGCVDRILPLDEIAPALRELAEETRPHPHLHPANS